MILECPACHTRYNVADGAIGPDGRAVRCKSCGHNWHQGGPDAPELAPVTLPPEPEPEPASAPEWSEPEPEWSEAPAPRRDPARMWTAIAVAIGVALIVAVAALQFVGLDRVRAQLGMAPRSSVSLLLEVPRKPERRTLASGNELFALTGRIVNPTRERQRVPDIRAELRDAQGRVVYNWTITPPVRMLAPSASAEFDAAEVDVPKGARELNLSFDGARR